MATRRMISLKIIDTDLFLEMPISSRLLYYDLSMRADDDGFIDCIKKILKIVGATEDDLKILISKGYVICLKNNICIIRHWKINNLIRPDRYTETTYNKEKNILHIVDNKYEILDDNQMTTKCLPNDNQMTTNGRQMVVTGKDRIGKVSIDKVRLIYTDEFECAWSYYPKRCGSNSKIKAFSKWKSAINRGHETEFLIHATKKYQEYCVKSEITGTKYVMQATRFYGNDDEINNKWEVKYGKSDKNSNIWNSLAGEYINKKN